MQPTTTRGASHDIQQAEQDLAHHRRVQRLRPYHDRAAARGRRDRRRHRPIHREGCRPHQVLSRDVRLPHPRRHRRHGGREGRRPCLRRARSRRRRREQRGLRALWRGRGALRRRGGKDHRHEPRRPHHAHPSSHSSPARAERRAHHPDIELRRHGRLPGQLPLPRNQVGHRGLLRERRSGGRRVRHRDDHRRTWRRPHGVPLWER